MNGINNYATDELIDDVENINKEMENGEGVGRVYSQTQLSGIVSRKNREIEKMKMELAQLKLEREQKMEQKRMDEAKNGELTQNELTQLRKQLEAIQKEKIELETSFKKEKIETIRTNEIHKLIAKTTKPNHVYKLIQDQFKIDENSGKLYIETGDDDYISPTEFVQKFLKENPEYIPAPIGGISTGKQSKSAKSNLTIHENPITAKSSDSDIAKYIYAKMQQK